MRLKLLEDYAISNNFYDILNFYDHKFTQSYAE